MIPAREGNQLIGKNIAHYKILELIGVGGMGRVYRASDSRLDRDVALKILPADSAVDPEFKLRFEREAKAIAALKHPNIVTIYSIEEADGIHFLTMELVEGETLAEIIPPGGFPPAQFFDIAIPLADAVSSAHRRGITHRDLKPANIMLDREQRLKVLDFGLAKLGAPPHANAEKTVATRNELTKGGILLGTVAYMSPEQISGGDVGNGADIFALGIILFELLSGTRPFQGDNHAAILYSILNDEAPQSPGIPDTLFNIINRCLRKSPEDRYAGADQLRQALQDLMSKPDLEVQSVQSSPEAEAAFERGDWEESYKRLHSVGDQRDLSPDELEMLGTCAHWLGKADECMEKWEKACAAYAKIERNIDAARVALDLVSFYIGRNASAVAGGWQKRAERLLQNEPECIEQGYLLRRQTVAALGQSNFTRAMELNKECASIADRMGDPDLQAVALHDQGQILIARDDVEEGAGLVDEAMTSAMCGEVNPATMGNLYCRTMTVCRSLADFGRAREWSEAAWRWCEPYEASGFQGVCRIHSAETLRHLGRWGEAERAIRSACGEFEKSGFNGHAGEAFAELGELALHKGDFLEAEEAFRRAHEFGHDPVPGLPLLHLAQGKNRAALQSMERALDENPKDQLRRAKLLSANITIALENDELSLAEESIEELARISESFGCKVYQAHALMGRGALALKRDDHKGAAPPLRKAWSLLNGLGILYDAARARVFLAETYSRTGNREDAMLQLKAACKTFDELGAEPDRKAASRLIRDLA